MENSALGWAHNLHTTSVYPCPVWAVLFYRNPQKRRACFMSHHILSTYCIQTLAACHL